MNVLDFQTDKLITGINIIEGNLYWTDDNSEPKKLEIERFKKSDIGLNDGATTINGRLFDHTDVTVIRPHPAKAIELDLTDYDDTEFDEQRVTSPEPPFEQIFPRFSYRWRYEDGQYSPYAPFTQAAFTSRARNYGTANDPQPWDPNSAYNFNGTNGVIVNFENRSYENNATIVAAIAPAVNPDPNVSADWNDVGVAVLTSQEANYVEGFNTTMFNNVGRITLNNIPRGTHDVVEVDILYTESISSTIYVLETLLLPPSQRGIDFKLNSAYTRGVQGLEPDPSNPGSFLPPRSGSLTNEDYTIAPLSYSITTRKIYSALPANQLSRQFDDVPRLAKAQEVTANRLIYGNYLHQYDQQSGVSLDVAAIPAESFPHLNDAAIIANRLAASATDGLHVKGNRTYEVGVAYIDAFGRQGAMLQNVSTFNVNGTLNEANAFRTAFNQSTREALQVTINTPAPSWAKSYRYFIKDVSTDYQNLVSYNIYNDGGVKDVDSEFIWIEFQSTDRNKVQGGPGDNDASVLTARRINDDIQNIKTRFLVQDIENECPEVVRKQINRSIVSTETANTGSFRHNAYDTVADLTSGGLDQGTVNGQTSLFLAAQNTGEISIFQSQVVGAFNSFITRVGGTVLVDTNVTATIDFTDFSQPLYARLRQPTRGEHYASGGEDHYVEILSISTSNANAGSNTGRIGINFGDRFLVNSATREIEKLNIGTGLSSTTSQDLNFELLTTAISETAIERLEGKFWVKAARNSLASQQSTFTFEGAIINLTPHWFETEPILAESNLDLFWETSDTFCVCMHHGCPNKLNWFNSVAEVDPPVQANPSATPPVVASEGGVYLETTRIFDKFNSVQVVRGVRVNTPTDRYAAERKPYGLTWSGIFNSRTGINRLNQFITSDGITKELEPNYGSLQLLHTRDTNLIAACEDKIFRILADKDLLFNADGGGNVSASNRVLGQTTPFVGEYGISKNPESFASYGNNFWITDASRGVVLQVTPANGQINEISSNGLKDHFRDRLHSATKLVGAYDDYSDSYMLSMQGYDQNDAMIDTEDAIIGETSNITWRYEPARQGWSSRVSYIPEDGLSMNNKFYTYKGGKMFLHNSTNVPRNHFYNLPSTTDPNETSGVFANVDTTSLLFVNNNPGQVAGEFIAGLYSGTYSSASSIDFSTVTASVVNALILNFPTQIKADIWRTSVGWPASGAYATTQQSLSSPVTFTLTFGVGKTITITQPAGNIGCNYGSKISIGNPPPSFNATQTGQDPIYSNGSGAITAWGPWPNYPPAGTGSYLSTVGTVESALQNPTLTRSSYVSEIEVILNENPSALKDYLTLGYEGTPGWVATSIDTDSEDLTITNTWPFVKKEDKYFAPIVGQIPTYGLTNAGLGSAVADDGSTVFINGSQDKSGIKGFYNKVRLQNALETKAELFAINSENKISSN
tara:strand:- start:472 stop:4764 length:4293 start_codon:yes stop_codon:yes gene_type:complete